MKSQQGNVVARAEKNAAQLGKGVTNSTAWCGVAGHPPHTYGYGCSKCKAAADTERQRN